MLVLWDHKVLLDRLDSRVQKETLAPLVLLDHKGQRVNLVSLAVLELLEPEDHPVFPVQ